MVLQRKTFITKRDRQHLSKIVKYDKGLLQIAEGITKYDMTEVYCKVLQVL